MTNVHVQTGQGRKIEDRPTGFTIGDRKFKVQEILDRWDGKDDSYFKVLAEDGIIYILRHDLETDQWEVTLMDVTAGSC
ncbi:hypothetical protein [Geobacter sp. DSM 9736]|uniref:hypothetical protein n=1 Tax=Geobacter sp. DSM 9736 TaxID=1277350 RepID=UPI000B5F75DE|nr:hypothetical protein [Geobacter sp. DSM 9736]SNB44705.1 hypothetical protein SAMN06269301_0092 [Geobacter sp. DSM 9736]